MNNHFITERNRIPGIIIASILMIPTFGLPLWGLYEMFFEPHYWRNRWKLYRLFRKGKVKVERDISFEIYGDQITVYKVTIDGSEYSASIWDQGANLFGQDSMTLTKERFSNEDYIGLFIGSYVMRWVCRRTIKMIRDAERSL